MKRVNKNTLIYVPNPELNKVLRKLGHNVVKNKKKEQAKRACRNGGKKYE